MSPPRQRNLCRLTEDEIKTEKEFLESCRRFHIQMTATRDELDPACMTLSQLEARVALLEAALNRAITALEFADSPEGQMVHYRELVEQLRAVLKV